MTKNMLYAALVVVVLVAVLALYGRRLQRREAVEARADAVPEGSPELNEEEEDLPDLGGAE